MALSQEGFMLTPVYVTVTQTIPFKIGRGKTDFGGGQAEEKGLISLLYEQ